MVPVLCLGYLVGPGSARCVKGAFPSFLGAFPLFLLLRLVSSSSSLSWMLSTAHAHSSLASLPSASVTFGARRTRRPFSLSLAAATVFRLSCAPTVCCCSIAPTSPLPCSLTAVARCLSSSVQSWASSLCLSLGPRLSWMFSASFTNWKRLFKPASDRIASMLPCPW